MKSPQSTANFVFVTWRNVEKLVKKKADLAKTQICAEPKRVSFAWSPRWPMRRLPAKQGGSKAFGHWSPKSPWGINTPTDATAIIFPLNALVSLALFSFQSKPKLCFFPLFYKNKQNRSGDDPADACYCNPPMENSCWGKLTFAACIVKYFPQNIPGCIFQFHFLCMKKKRKSWQTPDVLTGIHLSKSETLSWT